MDYDPATQVIAIVGKASVVTATVPTGIVKVHFIDVGQADAIYIQIPVDHDVLIDGGHGPDGDLVVDYLQAQHCDDIELLVATHPHEDHIGGLPAVFEAFAVEQVIDSGYEQESDTYKAYEAALQAEKCQYYADNYQNLEFNGCQLQILTGDQKWDDTNDYSVVCKLTVGQISFLMMGDAETPVESTLDGRLQATLLKVGHHGSTSSSGQFFLQTVRAEVAIISVGAGNTYKHPAQATLDKLLAIGASIYRTDLNGNIVVTADGQTYSVKGEKSTPVISSNTNEPSETSASAYVASKKSDKYHLPTCSYASKIAPDNLVTFASREEAESAGYKPCGVCKP